MANFTQKIMVFLVMGSVILGLSGGSIIWLWVLLEFNMISFLGALSFNGTKGNGEPLQYLIVQSVASLMFLSVALGVMVMSVSAASVLTYLAMLLKLGGAPFHFWFLYIVCQMSWESFFLLSTVQKILPLVVLYYISCSWPWASVFSLLVSIVGSISSSSMKILLGYSSIFGLGWMLASIFNIEMVLCYMMMYMMGLLGVVAGLTACSKASESFLWFGLNGLLSWQSFFSLLSMSGMPPLAGFWAKLTVIQAMMEESPFLSFILVSLAGAFMMVYLRLGFQSWKMSAVSWPVNFYASGTAWIVLLVLPLLAL